MGSKNSLYELIRLFSFSLTNQVNYYNLCINTFAVLLVYQTNP
jgi:hypothetical protein